MPRVYVHKLGLTHCSNTATEVSCLRAEHQKTWMSNMSGLIRFRQHELTFKENIAPSLICLELVCCTRAGSHAPLFTSPIKRCLFLCFCSCELCTWTRELPYFCKLSLWGFSVLHNTKSNESRRLVQCTSLLCKVKWIKERHFLPCD